MIIEAFVQISSTAVLCEGYIDATELHIVLSRYSSTSTICSHMQGPVMQKEETQALSSFHVSGHTSGNIISPSQSDWFPDEDQEPSHSTITRRVIASLLGCITNCYAISLVYRLRTVECISRDILNSKSSTCFVNNKGSKVMCY